MNNRKENKLIEINPEFKIMRGRKFGIIFATVLIAALASVFVQSCNKTETKVESKSMEEIYSEEGAPVVVETIGVTDFRKVLSFFATLRGAKEAIERSSVGDDIAKINYDVGSYVKKGDVVIEFPTDNPALQYEQAKVGLENAKKTYDRMKALLEAGQTSQQNFDNVEANYLVQKRNFESLKQLLFVEAPISGVITEMYVKVGDNVGLGAELFSVAQTGSVKAKAWATEDEVAKIKVGMDAFIIPNGDTVRGKVTEVALAMDPQRRAFGVETTFPNKKKHLRSGVTADIQIITYENPNAIVIDRNYVQTAPDGSNFVYIAEGDKSVKRTVLLGASQDVNVEILSGLNPGDKMIVQGLNLIEKYDKIRVENK